jgi:tetratricopeptide (TPR) repeat protein
LALLAAGGVARAQAGGNPEAGRSHFTSGVEYYRDGDLKGALIEFKRAYSASPNYRVLYNLGQVSSELRDYVEAQRYFQRYLRDGGSEIDPARRREVESSVAKLAGRIATVVVSCNIDGAEVFVDDVSVGRSPLDQPLKLSVGTRRISAAISGSRRMTKVVEAAGGETVFVKLDLPPTPAAVAATTEQRWGAREAAACGQPSAALWIGIGAGALAVGAGVMGSLAAVDGAKYRDAIHRRSTADEIDSLHSRAATKALITDILLGATAVAATATLVVALSESSSDDLAPESDDSARAWLTVGPGSVSLAGTL